MPVDVLSPIEWDHPYNQNLVDCWIPLPHLSGGGKFYSLADTYDATLTLSSSSYGWKPQTRMEQAVVFGGSSYGAVAADADILAVPGGDFTMDAWVRWLSASTNTYFFSFGSSSSATPIIALCMSSSTSGRPRYFCRSNDSTTTESEGGSISDGAWHHVALTRAGTAFTLYLDGRSVASSTASLGTVIVDRLTMGALGRSSYSNNWAGAISSCDLWSRGWSAGDIFGIYEEGLREHPHRLRRVSPIRYILFGLLGGTSDVAVTISGVEASASVGSPTISAGVTFSTTGAAATSEVGSPGFAIGVLTPATAATATAVANDPTSVLVGVTAAPSGAAANSEVGNPTVTVGVTFTASAPEATAAVGSVSVGGDTVVSASTVGATAEAGSVSTVVGVAFTPSAATATAEVGGVSVGGDTQVSTSTVGATASVGSASVAIGVAFGVTAPEATAAAGSVSIVTEVAVSVSGAGATAEVGIATFTIGVVVAADGPAATAAVNPVTVTGTSGEDVEVIVVGPEAFAFAGPVGVRTVRFVQPDPWKSTSSPTVAGTEP